MKKLIILLFSSILLTACGHFAPYRPPIQQGNIITKDMIKQLKVGLSRQQVADIFGEPVLNNPFEQDNWIYIYTFKPSKGPLEKKQLLVYFKNNRVTNYTIVLPEPKKRSWR